MDYVIDFENTMDYGIFGNLRIFSGLLGAALQALRQSVQGLRTGSKFHHYLEKIEFG